VGEKTEWMLPLRSEERLDVGELGVLPLRNDFRTGCESAASFAAIVSSSSMRDLRRR